ncbi:MAG: 50S ribosomal protein L29 [Rickettsiaceae bacterium]|nr:50S ribosomal protein L29 [Rickettsiaceae bacterium]
MSKAKSKAKSKLDKNADYTAKALSALSIEKLRESMALLKKELFNLRFQSKLGELTNSSRFAIVKKNIARINTELSKRKNSGVK